MRLFRCTVAAVSVLGATACQPPPVLGDVSLGVQLTVDADGARATVRAHIDRLDDCRRPGDVTVAINGMYATRLIQAVGMEPNPCPTSFVVELPYADDGLTESLQVTAVYSGDVDEEIVDVGVLDGLPHRFVDLVLDDANDVLTRGSRHTFEVRPALTREHTASVALQRRQAMPPVAGTWLTPSSFEYAVSPTIAAGSGVLEVELTDVDDPRDCTIDDGRACTLGTTTRASRTVQIVER